MNETGSNEATETEITDLELNDTEGSEPNGQSKEKISQSKSENETEEDFEIVRAANKEYRLPKEAAHEFKSIRKAYTQSAQKAAELRSLVEQFEQDPDSAFEKALSKKGLDADTWAERRLMQKLEQLNKTPEQIRYEQLEKENLTYKQRDEKIAQQKQEAEAKALEAYVMKQLDEEISKAWKESKLPAEPYYLKQIGALIVDSMKLAQTGKVDRILTAKEAADIIVNKQRATWKNTLPTLSEDDLLELIGTEKFNALKKAELARLTKSATDAGFGQQRQASSKEAFNGFQSKRPLTEKEWKALSES
jgi:hypothetical protein